MPSLIDAKTRTELEKLLANMSQSVRLVHFTQTPACDSCQNQRELLEDLVKISDHLELEIHDLVEDGDKAREYKVSKVPATAVVGTEDAGIRFYGVTGGYEFTSLIEAILMVASGQSGLDPELENIVQLIDAPLHLEVMVTLTCPYCPKMVRLVHQMAFANRHIHADMIDSSEFPQLVQRYDVGGVPRTVINHGMAHFEGAMPPAQAIIEILKSANPNAYEELEKGLREASGEYRVREADPDHLYDTLIVGVGPAAMTATIYAARKALDTLVIGEHVGGQITNTASIENWPGIPEISGGELATAFRHHAERYPLAERLNTRITHIEKTEQGFLAHCTDDQSYQARSVIYCAGKQYRHLGVPGEARFLGHGIAFCATCDAPLFQDQRVAVVGGGNSAFTAARDLLSYAREIHIINVLPDFQADPTLYDSVSAQDKVNLHPAMHVKEFLGNDSLSGIRLESEDGSERLDLMVEGVFLEIGLEPNTGPIADLLPLTEHLEIAVNRDQSTSLAGFFAAGDCTDETEKQIVIAAGAGAKAALAADHYLKK